MDDRKPGKRSLFYFSTIRGIQSSAGDLLYIGLVFRYKADWIAAVQSGDVPTPIETEQAEIEKHLAALSDDNEVGEVFERYEMRDMGTDEWVVTWRIPIRVKDPEKKSAPMTTQKGRYRH